MSTISDVAREAGVSVATVSRALRGLPNVAASTRARVEEAAERLHYRPDPAASRLATGRTATVAVVVPILDSGYFATVTASAEAVLAANGFDLLVTVVGAPSERRLATIRSLLRRSDGLIAVNVRLSAVEAAMLREWTGVVASVGMELDSVSSVVVDDVEVARLATAVLARNGHTDIAALTGAHHDPLEFSVPERRRRGYRVALADAAVEWRPELEVAGDFTIRGGYDGMAQQLEQERPPSAVFAMSDEMAFGAMRAAIDRGLSIPDDLSLVGVDDHPLSWVVDLTTVDQRVGDHGALAARHVLGRLADDDRSVARIEVTPKLVRRGSVAER